MGKTKAKNDTVPYITRAHRQHSSLVTTIPKGVCVLLDIECGDILVFDVQCGKGYAEFKIQLKGAKHDGRGKGNPDRKNKGR